MNRRILVLAGLVILIALAALAERPLLSLEVLIRHEAAIRAAIRDRPLVASLAGFAVYSLVCFVPGTTGKSLVVGWLFGFWSALVQVNLGLTIVALITFGASRYLLRDGVERRLGGSIAALDRALVRDGAYYLFSLRVLHSPYSVTNYVMGATRIGWLDFWLATQLGMLPGNALFVYAGTQVPTLEAFAEAGVASLLSPPLVAAFLALAAVPLVVRAIRRRVWG